MPKIATGLGTLALVASLGVGALQVTAADHLDAPIVKKDGRTDITDVYAFRSYENPANTVLIMNVNPLAGVVSGTTFDPNGRYEFTVDNDGDAQPDLSLNVRFGDVKQDGRQRIQVKLGQRDIGNGNTNETVDLRGRGDHDAGKIWAGVRDDPFFFDLAAFNQQVKGQPGGRTFCDVNATDFFRGTNIAAIVVEVPSAWLTSGENPNIGVNGRTYHNGVLIDQMARPAINTVFVPESMKDAFNSTPPADMYDQFGQIFRSGLMALGGYSAADADALTRVLLPDLLTLDTSSGAGFLNGRQPANDVIDAELNIVTQGGLTSDCVNGNDKPLPMTFPYLAQPH